MKTEKSEFIRGTGKRVCSSPKRQTGLVAHSGTGVISRRAPEADTLLHPVPDSKLRGATPELMIN